jgi:hypothetical protein
VILSLLIGVLVAALLNFLALAPAKEEAAAVPAGAEQ